MEIAVVLLSYLLGSIPSGYILGARSGIDIRKAGSGNIGATNVARVLGKRRGILTLIADAAKGYLAVFIAAQLELGLVIAALAGIAAFLGHIFPLFLKFRGGKGVATAFGVFLALAPLATAALILVFAAAFAATRTASLSSMVTAAAAPVMLWAFSYSPILIATSAVMAAIIILRHHDNVKRLLAGTEPRFGTNSR